MFKITNISSGALVGLTEHPTYIQKAENGAYILCDKVEATGVSYNGAAYHLYEREPLDDLDTVVVTEIDGGMPAENITTLIGGFQSAAAEQFRHAIQVLTGAFSEAQALEVPMLYPAWETNRAYAVGDILSYGTNRVGDPQLYKVVQAHTSQADWIPGEGTESLYAAFGLDTDGYPLWSQPSGAHDAYNTDDIVDYEGCLYRSTINGNVWSPTDYPQGWDTYRE